MLKVFQRIDADDSREITWEEFSAVFGLDGTSETPGVDDAYDVSEIHGGVDNMSQLDATAASIKLQGERTNGGEGAHKIFIETPQ